MSFKITFYTIYGSIPICRSDTLNIGCFYFKNEKLNYVPANSWHALRIRTLNFISYPLGCLLVFTPSFFSHFHLSKNILFHKRLEMRLLKWLKIILRVIICNSQERNVKEEEQGRSVTWLFIYFFNFFFYKYYIYRVITSLSWVQACDLRGAFSVTK